MTLELRYILVCSIFLLRRNHVIYLFDVVMSFNDARITLHLGKFELRMDVTLQLGFVFVRHCDVFFTTSQLCYLFVDVVTFFDYVRITLQFGTFELRAEITL